MPDIPGISDSADVRRNRRKFVTIMRTERRLRNRLADIDWEEDVLRPKLAEFEQRTIVQGELPDFRFEDEDGDTPSNVGA